jgi:hypothetical protein
MSDAAIKSLYIDHLFSIYATWIETADDCSFCDEAVQSLADQLFEVSSKFPESSPFYNMTLTFNFLAFACRGLFKIQGDDNATKVIDRAWFNAF